MIRVKRTRIVPLPAMMIGATGLIPTIVALLARLSAGALPDTPITPFLMLIAFFSASLILAFLGGIWWGIALGRLDGDRFGRWFGVAVAPSVVALLISGMSGWLPRTAAILLGSAIIATLLVDRRLAAEGLVPKWWMRLRVPLSTALGLLTILLGVLM